MSKMPFFSLFLPGDFPYLSVSFRRHGAERSAGSEKEKPRETDWSGAMALNWEIICRLVSVTRFRVLLRNIEECWIPFRSWFQFRLHYLISKSELMRTSTPTFHLLIVSKADEVRKIIFLSLFCLQTTQLSVNHRTFQLARATINTPKRFL